MHYSRINILIIAVNFILLMSGISLHADGLYNHPLYILNDRPCYSLNARTMPAGVIQIESGYRYKRLNRLDEHEIGESLIRVGLWRQFELRLGINSYTLTESVSGTSDTTKSGKDDFSVGMKIKLLEHSKRSRLHLPHTSLLLQTPLPSGNSEVSENAFQPEARLCFSFIFSDYFQSDINLAYTYAREEGERFDKLASGIKFTVTPTSRFDLFIEHHAELPYSPTYKYSNTVQFGLSYQVSNNIEFDLHYEVQYIENLSKQSAGIGISAMLPWTF